MLPMADFRAGGSTADALGCVVQGQEWSQCLSMRKQKLGPPPECVGQLPSFELDPVASQSLSQQHFEWISTAEEAIHVSSPHPHGVKWRGRARWPRFIARKYFAHDPIEQAFHTKTARFWAALHARLSGLATLVFKDRGHQAEGYPLQLLVFCCCQFAHVLAYSC